MSPSTSEIFRRTRALFEKIDRLEYLALSSEQHEDPANLPRVKFSRAGLVLQTLNEYNIRNMCGEAIYGPGLQDYMQGRVSEKRFSSNTIRGKLDESGRKWLSTNSAQFFEPYVTLERKNSNKFRVYGDCGCGLAQEGSLCPHIAALMIAWVRSPQEFEYQVEDEFERARQQVIKSVRELALLIKERGSRTCDLELLQRTYSKLKIWSENVRNSGLTRGKSKKSMWMVREFSSVLNHVSLAVMSAIESKYEELKAIDSYNSATISAFANVLDQFVEGMRMKKSFYQLKAKQTNSGTGSTHTARSWDVMVESYVGR